MKVNNWNFNREGMIFVEQHIGLWVLITTSDKQLSVVISIPKNRLIVMLYLTLLAYS